MCYLDDFPLPRDRVIDRLRMEMFDSIKAQILSFSRNKCIANPKAFIPDFMSVLVEILRAAKRKQTFIPQIINLNILSSKAQPMEIDDDVIFYPDDAEAFKCKTVIDGIVEFIPIVLCMITSDEEIIPEFAKLLIQFINTEEGDQYIKSKMVAKKWMQDIPRLCSDVMKPNRITDQLMLKSNIHLMALLLMDVPTNIMEIKAAEPILKAICELVQKAVELENWHVPYLPNALFLIEIFLKKHRLETRRSLFNRQVDSMEWSYRAKRVVKYQKFSEKNQALLSAAFMEGKTSLAITEKRNLRMMVDLTKMLYRPIDQENDFHTIKLKIKVKEGTNGNDIIKQDDSLKPDDFDESSIVNAIVKIMKANTKFSASGPQPAERSPLPYELVYSVFSLLIQVFEIRNARKTFIESGGIQAIIHQELEKFTPEITLIAFVAFTRSLDIGIQPEKEIEATIQAALKNERYNNSNTPQVSHTNEPFDKDNFFYRMTPLCTHPQFFDIFTKNIRIRGNNVELSTKGNTADFVNIQVEEYKENVFRDVGFI